MKSCAQKCGNKALDLLLAPWQHYIVHPCIGNTPTTWYCTTYLGHAGPKCHGARKLGVLYYKQTKMQQKSLNRKMGVLALRNVAIRL
jgi:hypothetical protein